MAQQVGIIFQMRRGTAAQIAGFTPAQGEVVGDMTYFREVVGDGVTVGGWPTGKANLVTLADASTYSVKVTDAIIVFNSLTATSTNNILLPSAAQYPPGQELHIHNGTTVAGTIKVKASSTGNADSINSTVSFSMTLAAGGASFFTNGSTGWIGWSS